MSLEVLCWVVLGLAAIPALLFLVNLCCYRRAPKVRKGDAGFRPAVSVLIPARDEEANIAAALEAVLANRGVDLEVIVLDDQSTDRTADLVRTRARNDDRVRLVSGETLPAGWCGKQFACHQLARHARHPLLVFLDADVRLEPDALMRLASFQRHSGAALVSGIPRQLTITWAEKLLLPLIHFVLLSFLPMFRMRRTTKPAYAAGCGQLFLAEAKAYARAGGHAAIRASRHDGLTLPRAFRRAGLRTDLFDATDLAVCRMYRDAGEVRRGLMKNATEGLASPRMILPASLLLLGGQVLPWALAAAVPWMSDLARVLWLSSLAASALPRWLAVWRFGQPMASAALHPLGVAVLVGLQWAALAREWQRRPVTWKGRLPTGADPEPTNANASSARPDAFADPAPIESLRPSTTRP